MEYLQDIFLKEKDEESIKKNFKDWLHDILSEKIVQVTYFDIEQYRNDYSDLEMASVKSDYDLIWHMIHHGCYDFRELFSLSHIGEKPFILQKDDTIDTIGDVVDWERYILEYTDLRQCNIITKEAALNHIIEFGHNEHRNVYLLKQRGEYIHCFKQKMYEEIVKEKFSTEEEAYYHWYNNYKEELYHPYLYINTNELFKNNTSDHYFRKTLYKILHKYCSLNEFFLYEVENFDSTQEINTETLVDVNKNIDYFEQFISIYKNILFICSDYPGYGGAATNCSYLSNYFKKNHFIYSIYWNWDYEENKKFDTNDEYTIVKKNQLEDTIKNLHFTPELIILKSTCEISLKKIIDCPIIFLIPGIYVNDLNVHYTSLDTQEKQDKFINMKTIKQIKESDYSFTNSKHVKDILYKWYNLNCGVFCSSFINYYKNTILNDLNFHKRKYDYGLIVSDFTRKIKDVSKSIDFLKDKSNSILIGKGSEKYKDLGLKCIELVNKEDMELYYKQIKYIVQDSFFESCSNVLVESIFFGCKKMINFLPFKKDISYLIKKETLYILGNVTDFYVDIYNYFDKDNIMAYVLDNYDCKELVFFIYSSKDIEINTSTLTITNVVNDIIGYNNRQYNEDEFIDLYYLYGHYNIDKNFLDINNFYQDYVFNTNRKYNKLLFTLIQSYDYGCKNNTAYYKTIKDDLQKDIFHDKSILFISKIINGYGGVQKTSMQIITFLDKYFNVDIISSRFFKSDNYNFQVNRLNNNIPHSFIVKKTLTYQIETLIRDKQYEIIFNNKLNEAINWDISKSIVMCHNSMDPFNMQLIRNEEKIDKLFVVNKFHKNLLLSNGFMQPIKLYQNYVYTSQVDKINNKKQFSYSLAFVGRLSKEKNIQHLINGINEYNKYHEQNLTLYIIGDGTETLVNINDNIKLLGKLQFNDIVEMYKQVDYIISSSVTEGKPFSLIEAMSYGIPCIHSDVNGINEIIINGINGFLFEMNETYKSIRYDLTFDKLKTVFSSLKTDSIVPILDKAYKINISQWNEMSTNAYSMCKDKYDQTFCFNNNIENINGKLKMINNKRKIFFNFKPNENIAYGGGNISVFYLIRAISNIYSDYEITYELEPNTCIYVIIDPFKDNKFKVYSLEDVINYKNQHGGKIVIRVNDCDKTRVVNDNNSRELQIMNNFNAIDFFIFNSNYIKTYYFDKFKKKNLSIKDNFSVIINGCDQRIFYDAPKILNDKIKLVTHHWSSNMHKGYQLYYNLWKYTQTSTTNIDFTFIGQNVPDMFKSVPILGPFSGRRLADHLNKYHIYITDSVYDSCPNHVIEAISCGLPILCSNKQGGSRELTTMSPYKIGDLFTTFDDLLRKIDIIINNYDFYIENVKKTQRLFNVHFCANNYYNQMIKISSSKKEIISTTFMHVVLNVKSNSDNGYIFLNNSTSFKLLKGENVIYYSKNEYKNVEIIDLDGSYTIGNFKQEKLQDNNKVNVLLCSDQKYFVGLFASLYSVIDNTSYIEKAHFNFIIPIEEQNIFSNMLQNFENKISATISKTILYLDTNILYHGFFNLKCYNGGGHLLNVGNLSRLLIGEMMEYEKLIYLDSDSIVQYDIINKLSYFTLKQDMYACLADRKHKNNRKQITITMKSVLNEDCKWKQIIGQDINMNEYVFMGAPFITNCKKWKGVYNNMIKLTNAHNNKDGGIFKLFTMSLQNLLFYNKMGNINEVLDVIQDLGSDRKSWDREDLLHKDVIDWSGVFKPWFTNGLYKNYWKYYDIMNLSLNCGNIVKNKKQIETF